MRRIILFLVIGTLMLLLSACNYTVVDTNYTFDYAILSLPDGTTVKGKIEKWRDYRDGDQIQVTVDDITYLVHSSDLVLIKEAELNE